MALIFNSITQFEIQPERTKHRVKRDDLDTLTEVWVGPTILEDIFVPLVGNVHPDWSLMTVIDTSIKRLAASVSEVTINYHGKLDNSGTGGYTSLPTISQSWMEGEVSFQVPYSKTQSAIYSRRYTGRAAQVSYLTNLRPTGNPSNIGMANDYLGFTNVWDTITGFAPDGISGSSSPIQIMTCTDVKVDDKAHGWYLVTETYQSKMFPGSVTPPSRVVTAPISVQTVTTSNTLVSSTGTKAQAGAQGAANSAGASLPGSSPGSVQYQVYTQTGVDPAWMGISDAISAGIANAASDTQGTNIGDAGVPLTF